MRFTIDLLGTELLEIRYNDHQPNNDGPPLGFTIHHHASDHQGEDDDE